MATKDVYEVTVTMRYKWPKSDFTGGPYTLSQQITERVSEFMCDNGLSSGIDAPPAMQINGIPLLEFDEHEYNEGIGGAIDLLEDVINRELNAADTESSLKEALAMLKRLRYPA